MTLFEKWNNKFENPKLRGNGNLNPIPGNGILAIAIRIGYWALNQNIVGPDYDKIVV